MRPVLPTLCALALLAAAGQPALASWTEPEAGRPILQQVFGPVDYGTTAENHSVVRDRRGRLFVGNDGVRVFDGRNWSHVEMKGVAPVRALAVDDDDRVWVAANGDYGYLEEGTDGTPRFHSLMHLAPTDISRVGWGVFRQDDCTLFVMHDALLVWDGSTIEVFPLPNQNRLFSFRFREAIAISDENTLWMWSRGRLEPLDLAGLQTVSWAVARGDGSDLVRTRAGLHRVSAGVATPIPRESTNVMHQALETAFVRLPGGLVCVTTLTGGLFLLSEGGSIVRQLNRDNGLPSQACYGVFLDDEHGLWVATNRHVIRLDARHLASRFDETNGLGGAVRVLERGHGTMIALTEERACELVLPNGDQAHFAAIPSRHSFYWDVLALTGGRVLFGGLRSVVDHRLNMDETVLRLPSTVLRLVANPSQPDLVIAASWPDLIELDTREGFQATGRVLGSVPSGAVDLSFDADGRLWAAQYRRGIFSVRPDHTATTAEPLDPSDQPPFSLSEPRLFSLGGTVHGYNAEEVWRLPREGESAPRHELTGIGLFAAERIGSTDVWALARRGDDSRLVRLETDHNGTLTATIVECPGLETLGRVQTIARDREGRALWIGGFNGALRLDLPALPIEPPPPAPRIMRIERRVGDEPGMLLSLAGGVRVDFDGGAALAFDVRDAADVLGSPARLEARLLGRESGWSATGLLRTYTGLREGGYEFQVRTVDLLGRVSPVTSYTFTVVPPWFRTAWAYAGYVLAGLTIVGGSAQLWALRVKRRNLRLEQIVKQRTEELTRAITARTAFLANMGHEIRNPLNGVVGLIDSLRAGEHDPDHRRLTVERLGSCADQLVAVVEDVLEFSRVDAGRIAIRPRPFVVREPLEAAIDIFRAAEPDRTLALEAAPSELAARVVGDPDRIRQVLVNYLANALKFAPAGPVTAGVEKRGDGYTFSVSDSGPGIPLDDQARLFMRFSRGSFAHREGIPGTGLGLAACKGYAEAMGGEVWVESEPGRGATFFLRVPLRPAVAGEILPTTIVPDIMAGRTALVVDDHEFNRIVLGDLLGRMGAIPRAVADLASAREAFTERVPDVVFVDFDLAGGATGADLARWIRGEAARGRDVPVIATSAFEVEEVRRRCAEAGMDGFIAKPVTAHKVAEMMSRIDVIRSGGAAQLPSAISSAPSLVGAGFLDLMSDGDPVRRRELERAGWKEIAGEAAAAFKLLRRGNLPEAGRHAHRLTSAALLLGLAGVVAASRNMTGAARSGDASATVDAADKLRQALVAAKRQRPG